MRRRSRSHAEEAAIVRPELPAFAYHDVTDDPTDTGFQRPGALPYRLTCDGFRLHLSAIASAARAPALVTDDGLAHSGRRLLLTFDDGGRSALRIGDMLAERGWRGHFFVVTGLLGSRTFLDADGVRALRRAGHLVGSHSHTHPDIFRELSRARMVEEWRVSRERLEEILGEPCVAASVPGGDSSDLVPGAAAEAGLRFLFTSEPELVPRDAGGVRVLGRFCAKRTTPVERIAALADGRGWAGALLRRRASVLARRSLPSLYRWYVRGTTRPASVAS
jgi:peptidoglycan/xylan/chitin deacetylase (PgdA/CDA1 family)